MPLLLSCTCPLKDRKQIQALKDVYSIAIESTNDISQHWVK